MILLLKFLQEGKSFVSAKWRYIRRENEAPLMIPFCFHVQLVVRVPPLVFLLDIPGLLAWIHMADFPLEKYTVFKTRQKSEGQPWISAPLLSFFCVKDAD